MSYQYHGKDTIALPGRTVQTFPSGLVRVEQMYAVKKGFPAPFKARDKFPEDFSIVIDGRSRSLPRPSLDGLYVFPEPEIASDEDGFTKYKVTAYGRKSIQPTVTKGFVKSFWLQISTRTIQNEDGSVTTEKLERKIDSINSSQSLVYIVDEFEGAPIYFPSDNAIILGLNDSQTLSRGTASYNEISANIAAGVSVFWDLVGVNYVNYGRWTEYTVNYQASAIQDLSPALTLNV